MAPARNAENLKAIVALKLSRGREFGDDPLTGFDRYGEQNWDVTVTPPIRTMFGCV